MKYVHIFVYMYIRTHTCTHMYNTKPFLTTGKMNEKRKVTITQYVAQL